MKKTYLNSFCARFLTLLVLALMSTNLAWGEETTVDIIAAANITTSVTLNGSNGSYKMGETPITLTGTKGTNNFPALNYNATSGVDLRFYKGTTCSVTFAISNAKITKIEFLKNATTPSTLGEAFSVDEGTLTNNVWEGNAASVKLSYSNSNANFSGQMYIIKVTYSSNTPAKTLESIVVSGNPDKTNYKSNEAFDPTGLTVTGYYDDETNAQITSGIEWTVIPSGNLPVGTTSVSVTAKVGEITSPAYQVNGLTVTEFVQTFANTYTSYDDFTHDSKVIWKGEEYDAAKLAKNTPLTITVQANTKNLHIHAAAWNKEGCEWTISGLTEDVKITAVADAGVANNSPFTLQNDPETNDYFVIATNNTTDIELTITLPKDKRGVLFGVNAEEFKTHDVTISDAGYATLGLPYAVTIPTGVSAYTATVSENVVTLNPIEGTTIPADCGVILKANEGKYTFTESVDVNLAVDNDLVAVTAEGGKDITGTEEGIYFLSTNTNGVVFKLANGGNIPQYKAYLQSAGSEAKLDVVFGEPTGIKSLTPALSEGKGVYNLNGLKVNEAYKGIVIMNGKKYINK